MQRNRCKRRVAELNRLRGTESKKLERESMELRMTRLRLEEELLAVRDVALRAGIVKNDTLSPLREQSSTPELSQSSVASMLDQKRSAIHVDTKIYGNRSFA